MTDKARILWLTYLSPINSARPAHQQFQVKRAEIERIYETEGYKAAKAAADKAGILWFASAGATTTTKAGA